MNYYVIGIGGTGAKCTEALVHLCAAGLMPDGELYALFVDPDTANGNLERAGITLQQYINCRGLNYGRTELLRTRVTAAKPNAWSPFENQTHPSLENFFYYNTLKVSDKPAAHLFDVLYSNAEKQTPLEKGFRGHPSIGAAVMAETVKLGEDEPWQTFRTKVMQDIRGGTGAKIFLFGSIFGGTGASGFPTIAKLIYDELKKLQEKEKSKKELQEREKIKLELENIKLGGALILPYFSFIYHDSTEADKIELKAKSEDFLITTQAGLKYYCQKYKDAIYNAIYLLGDEAQSAVSTTSLGGNTQKNEAHFIEFYAALSAIDFFTKENPQNYHLIARKGKKELDWDDLPDNNGGRIVREKIGQLIRFAFAYLSVYYPMLEDIRKSGKGYRSPWFIDLFERENISLNDSSTQASLNNMKDYCESFLLWIANLHHSARGESINLIKWDTFAKVMREDEVEKVGLLKNFGLKDFCNVIMPLKKERPNELSELWEWMSSGKAQDSNAVGIGKFISALYLGCKLKE